MSTVSRGLPERPHLDVPKREARELLDDWRKRDPDALERIRHRHPRFRGADDPAVPSATFRLSDATGASAVRRPSMRGRLAGGDAGFEVPTPSRLLLRFHRCQRTTSNCSRGCCERRRFLRRNTDCRMPVRPSPS